MGNVLNYQTTEARLFQKLHTELRDSFLLDSDTVLFFIVPGTMFPTFLYTKSASSVKIQNLSIFGQNILTKRISNFQIYSAVQQEHFQVFSRLPLACQYIC